MTECKKCGANLPDQARFCHQCGESVAPEPVASTPSGPPPELDFVRPAIMGGMFLGLLSSMPIVSLGNYLCCMWVIGGGVIATYMLRQQQPGRKLTFGDGAFAGVSSGLFGAMVATIVSIPIKILTAPLIESSQQAIEEFFKRFPEMDPQMMDLMRRLLSPEISAVTVLITFISNVIVYALFAMVGGILTVAALKRRQDPSRQRS